MAQNTTQDDEVEKLFGNSYAQAQNFIQQANDIDKASAGKTFDDSGRKDFLHEFAQSYKAPQLTEEEKKRERNKRMIAALGDGLTSLANFAGAVHGATPLQQKVTLTEAQKRRFDDAQATKRGLEQRNYELGYNTAVRQQAAEDARYKAKQDLYLNGLKLDAQRSAALRNKAADIYRGIEKEALAHGINKERLDAYKSNLENQMKNRDRKTSADIANDAKRTAIYGATQGTVQNKNNAQAEKVRGGNKDDYDKVKYESSWEDPVTDTNGKVIGTKEKKVTVEKKVRGKQKKKKGSASGLNRQQKTTTTTTKGGSASSLNRKK